MVWLGKKNCHEDCGVRIMDYLSGKKKGKRRSIGFDCLNFDLDDGLVEPRWAGIMDTTRELFGNHTDWRGKRCVKYYHFVISPDPSDEVDLETLRALAKGWAAEMFGNGAEEGRLGSFETAIVYHDDNGQNIPHAHIIVNNTNLVDGRRMQISDSDNKMLGARLQSMAADAGLSYFSDDPGKRKQTTAGRYTTKAERELLRNGQYSWKQDIANNIMVARRLNRDEDGFLETLGKLGVDAREKDGDYVFTHRANEQRWRVTGYRLGKYYTRDHILTRLDENRREYTEALEKERDNTLQFLLEAKYDIDDLGEVMNHSISVRDAAFALKANEQFQIRAFSDYAARIALFDKQLSATYISRGMRNAIEADRYTIMKARDIAARGNFFKDTDLGRPTIDRYKPSPRPVGGNPAKRGLGGSGNGAQAQVKSPQPKPPTPERAERRGRGR